MPSPTLTLTQPLGPAEAVPVLLGHSLGTCAALWSGVVPLLARSFRVIRWDLPGHGHSPTTTMDFTIGDLSDALIEHLDAQGISQFLYAGVSIGGTVGLDLALRYPDRVAAAAIVSAGSSVDSPAAWVERAAAVRANGTASLTAGSVQRWFAPSTRAHQRDRIDEMIGALHSTDDESYARACEALAAYDITANLAQIAPPVLALWGEHDELVPQQRSTQIAAGVRCGAVRRVLNAAHASPLEQPETVAGQLIEFFGSVPASVATRGGNEM